VNKLRSKLLASFLLCMTLPAGLGVIIFGYQNEHRQLDDAIHEFDSGRLFLQESYQATREFFNFAQRDPHFYQTGESSYLDTREAALKNVRATLDHVHENHNLTLHHDLEQVLETLKRYDAQFIILVDLFRLRGFHDYGVVGEMRSGILSFDDADISSELKVTMLSLRRQEKDYIIRNQSKYVDGVAAETQALREGIEIDPSLKPNEKARLLSALDKYTNAFRQLIVVDQRIGVRGHTGLFQDLSDTERQLDADYHQLQATYNDTLESTRDALTDKLYYAMALVFILSVAISIFLSSSLTRRLRILSDKIRKFVDSGFKEPVTLGRALTTNDEVGRIAHDFKVLQDAMQEHVSSIREMAYYDMLTGLASRSYLNQRLTEMISAAERSDDGFALFFIDLDAFKDVNDSLGHDAGDQLLVAIGQRLSEAARTGDFVARLGGDEFCMLLNGLQDEGDIAQVAERVINNIEQNVVVHERNFKPQASIGISRYPADGDDARKLMQAGDNAMYAAKNAGNHRFEFFNREMTQKAAERFTLAQELRNAFKEEQFLLHYQPQVSIQSGDIHAWEALVRWQHPSRGMVPPGEFVPEIERLGLIKDLGNWVIQEASRQIVRWQTDGMTRVRVSVNIAPRHFDDPNLISTIRHALDESGLAPWQLELEVTETDIQSSPKARGVLEELRKMGVPVAIDDFGTGYSSLGSLKHLPVDCLKIDRTFIDTVGSTQDEILLGTIMSLGHALNFRIVAEGVEELEQLQMLQGMDCDLVQGYYFSRPIAAVEVPEMARRGFQEKAKQIKSATELASAAR
jgi:diguanylate cyclase (GGDEF)-like protein